MADVLAIAPHPDDIELGAGGTVALLAAAGRRVVLLDLTRGERATRGTPEIRAREAVEAAVALGAAERACLDLPDGALSAGSDTHAGALVAAIRSHRPRLVLAMDGRDDHPDHVAAALLVRKACYLAGLRNYAPGTDPWRPARLLFAMGRRPFDPALVVDVSAHYETKRRAVGAFRSQFERDPGDSLVTPISEPGFLARLEARDRWFGGMIGAEFGEPFAEDGPVPARDAAALLGGEAR